ncbi:MAG: amidohydrolase family protein [Hamadaea sp.]|uniref:amidohydrolase family protein n=1 Tax=Hamadaea sp. TaxID=2024425 RepID=UPI0018025716|nr:amidohydrolase family protein [Hamadaea sp.]NUT20819.1 amidohydrolase family protein [Hamadaea sp.]
MRESVAALPLTDHHCHGVVRRDLDAAEFAGRLTEGPRGAWDSLLGFAVRDHCAPLLDLPAHAPAADYLDRRASLGHAEVTARFLAAANLGALCIDTGYTPEPLLTPQELGAAAGAAAHEVVRLEQLAEQLLTSGVDAMGFATAVREKLAGRARDAVAAKSVVAYRMGLSMNPQRPTDSEVTAAAGLMLATIGRGGPARIADETLHRFLIWTAVDLGMPLQLHTGFGDPDLNLHQTNPALLTSLLRAIEPTGVPVLLLHTYPYHREAGYLTQAFDNVYFDVGLALHNVGSRATAVLAEALELAPFTKMLYSSDAYALPEHYYLAATMFRQALSAFLAEFSDTDATRIAHLIGVDNATRVYNLPH